MTQNNKQIEKFRKTATETNIALFKVLFASLGPLGTALDEAIFGVGERIRGRRLEQFVAILSDKVNNIESQLLNKNLNESEDFYDLSISIINSALKTRLEAKHEILSNIFIDSIREDLNWETSNSQIFIKYVNELTESHIIIFDYLVKKHYDFKELKSYEKLYVQFISDTTNCTIDTYEFRMYLRDLENKTLLSFNRDINEFGSSGGLFATEDYEQIPGILVTTVGKNFYNYIKK